MRDTVGGMTTTRAASVHVAAQQSFLFSVAATAPKRNRGKALAAVAVRCTHAIVADLHDARIAAWTAATSVPGAETVVLTAAWDALHRVGDAPTAWHDLVTRDHYLVGLRAAVAAAIRHSSPNRRPDLSTALRHIVASLDAVVRDGEALCQYMVTDLTSRGEWYTPREELLQEARMAVVTAAVRFDPFHGMLFRNFACTWIRGLVTRHEEDHGRTVRVPVHARAAATKIFRYLGEHPGASESDIVAATGLRVSTIRLVHECVSATPHVSMKAIDGSTDHENNDDDTNTMRPCHPALLCGTPEDDLEAVDRRRTDDNIISLAAALNAAVARKCDPEVVEAVVASTFGDAWPTAAAILRVDPPVRRRRAQAAATA